MKMFLSTLIITSLFIYNIIAIQPNIEDRYNKAYKNLNEKFKAYLDCVQHQPKKACKQLSDEENIAKAQLLIYSYLIGCTEELPELDLKYKNNPQTAMNVCLKETEKIMNLMPTEMQKIKQKLNN
jgi:hypothetical protein